MESKLNTKAIEEYATGYAEALLADLYAGKERLTGQDLLALPVEQTGLLVVARLFNNWRSEASRLKSPFFDYSHPEVQEALQKFMNVLSRHISIGRDDLQPILQQAVSDTLLLVLSPYTFCQRWLTTPGLQAEDITSLSRFIKLNKPVWQAVADKVEQDAAVLADPQALLDEVFNHLDSTPDDSEEVLAAFGKKLPVEADRFFIKEATIPEITPLSLADDEEEEEEEAARPTLNDRFGGQARETLADRLQQNQPAASLKSMLSINQKFMFINDLFDGNQEDFLKVLDFLDSCESKEVAVSFIHNNYLKHNRWKANAPQVREFMALLDRRFAGQAES